VGVSVAIGPDPAPAWVTEAVLAGGADVVDPGEAEGFVWANPTGPDGLRAVLDENPQIRWVHLRWAGVEEFAAAGLFGDGRTWTCGKGVFAEPVAEHALALGLAGLRHLPTRALATGWGEQSGVSLFDGRVTILGGGGITECLLDLLRPFRCETTVLRRDASVPVEGATRTLGIDALHDSLPGADLVVLALALTPETAGIIGSRELALMESHAWLVNVARGKHVVTDDLVRALDERTIGGAALDVTDPEPLPDGHPLFGRDNCIVTPHTANTFEMAKAPLTARITENVRRFDAGEPLIGLVDVAAGY
jgi:phosphoglycerate dehydrogenase-like enzyme